MFMHTQLRVDARKRNAKLARLRDVVVRAGIQPQDRVDLARLSGEYEDRLMDLALLQQPACIASIHIWQVDV